MGESVSSGYPNSKKKVETDYYMCMMRSELLLTEFEVFG